jgi:quercetin dioxygenase-like cupin family protein
MNVIKIDEQPLFQNPHGVDIRKVFENENTGIMQIILKPGEEIPRHPNPVNAFFFVHEGSGLLEVEDEKQVVGKNSLIEVPANIIRGWKNNSNDLLKILVIKIL